MSLSGHLDVQSDDVVRFAFTVQNTGLDPVELEFRGGKIVDVAVSTDDGEIWRWSEDRMFTQALQTEPLAPGESFTYELTWEEASPGNYTAVATLEAKKTGLVDRVSFKVP